MSRNGIKTENPFEGRLWPESKLNEKEAGSTVWDEGSGFCMEGCTMTQRKRLQKAFSLLFVLCLVFSLAGGMSASAEMTLHTGASKEAVSEETNENSEKETEGAGISAGEETNAGQTIIPARTDGKTETPGETAQETGDHTTEAQGTDSRATEAAAAFDITFLTADGTRVQPGNGKTVSVSFSVAAGSALTAGEQEMASLEVYHIGENDMATLVKSVPAPDSSTSSDISIEADSFSVYMLLKKTDD